MSDRTINEITLFEEQETFVKTKFEDRYPMGKVLYLNKDEYGNSKVIAITEYVRYYSENDYLEIYRKNSSENDGVTVKVIEPSPYYVIGNKNPEHYDNYEDFVENVVPKVAEQLDDYVRNYEIELNKVKVYFTINDDLSLTYYGLSKGHVGSKILKDIYNVETMNRLEATRFLDDIVRDRLIKNAIQEKCPKSNFQEKRLYRDSLKNRLDDYSYEKFRNDMRNGVKGQPEIDDVCIAIYQYLTLLTNTKISLIEKCNTIIAAPSGCGKTETYRKVRELFEKNFPEVEVMICNMSSFSSVGYKGQDISDFVKTIAEKCKNKKGAIVFLDEIDKKLIPEIGSKGFDYSKAVQNEMLTMIEGQVYDDFDTSKVLFIGLGSFAECRSKRKEVKNSIGFTCGFEKGIDHYEGISIEDIIDSGATYELMGRFSQVVNYYKLSKEIVYEIIDEYADSFCEMLFANNIKVSSEFKEELFSSANSPMGVRVIKNKIKKSIMIAFEDITLEHIQSVDTVILRKGGFKLIEKQNMKLKG